MGFTIAVTTHFFPIDQFLGLAGSFSQSSSKLEDVSATLPAGLRSLSMNSVFSGSSWVTEVVTLAEGTSVVPTLRDIIPNGCGSTLSWPFISMWHWKGFRRVIHHIITTWWLAKFTVSIRNFRSKAWGSQLKNCKSRRVFRGLGNRLTFSYWLRVQKWLAAQDPRLTILWKLYLEATLLNIVLRICEAPPARIAALRGSLRTQWVWSCCVCQILIIG